MTSVQVSTFTYSDSVSAEWSDLAEAVIVRFGDDVKVRMPVEKARALAADLEASAVAGERASLGCDLAATPVG